jgi:hypothetical protein
MMEKSKTQLRHDNAHSPTFLMIGRPPSPDERRERLAEWILAVWMNLLDPNVMGVRRVDDEKNGDGVPMVHIAIPLDYRRKQLAVTLSIAQIEDDHFTPRINLISSAGTDEPHSFIRVPAEVIFSKFRSSIEFQLLDSKELNDPTIKGPERAIDDFSRVSKRKNRDEDARLRLMIQQGLATKNAVIGHDQIQMLIHKKTGEKWVKIKNIDRSMRATIQLTIMQAGIRAVTPSRDDLRRLDWAILFAATEADKLLLKS